METNPDSKSTIENLKAAGEEFKKAFPPESDQKEKNPSSVETEKVEEFAAEAKEGIDLFKRIREHQKELNQELTVLERAYQDTKELEKRLGERIEFLKGLQTKGVEINKELKEFEEQFTLAKKANRNLLEEVKNKLKGGK